MFSDFKVSDLHNSFQYGRKRYAHVPLCINSRLVSVYVSLIVLSECIIIFMYTSLTGLQRYHVCTNEYMHVFRDIVCYLYTLCRDITLRRSHNHARAHAPAQISTIRMLTEMRVRTHAYT